MSKKIDRRSFLNRTILGLGSVAFSSPGSMATNHNHSFGSRLSTHERSSLPSRKLLATTDYYSNILSSGRFFNRSHFDQLHKYLASLGVTRHQWTVDTIWDLYENSSTGFDIIAEATESAHAHGLDFFAQIKPFEGGGFGINLPHTLPVSDKSLVLKDMRGIYPAVRPFVVQNPHLCMRRRPGTFQFKGPITSIRLVKENDEHTSIEPEHISIWTSATNNQFEEYHGTFSFRSSVEIRPTFPRSRNCRILHLEDLDLPHGHSYILIRISSSGLSVDFSNERGRIVELSGPHQQEVPFILSTGSVRYEEHNERLFQSPLYQKLLRYFQEPEILKVINDERLGREHYRDYFSFAETRRITESYSLNRIGYLCIACGKPEYMLGNLHPIYPEVRKHWLDMVGYCLDRGVDGINFRHDNHARSPEDWEYGFNEEAIKAANDKTDYPSIQRVNGSAYTQFLREARELIKSRDKTITIHLYTRMLHQDDRPGRLNYFPPNVEWQWKTWINEIADDLELRGVWMLRSWNLQKVLETFREEANAAGKPLYYQGNMFELREAGMNNPRPYTRNELKMLREDPGLDGFVLYETNHISKLNDMNEIEGCSSIKELVKNEL